MGKISHKKIISNLKFVYSDNNTISVIFHNNDLLLGVVGDFYCLLRVLEKVSGANIFSWGISILLKNAP